MTKMVPAKSKSGSAIDNQWLEPSSYDKKMVDAMAADPEMYDQEDHEAENFTVQNKIKKNTRAPLKEDETGPVESDSSSVNELYEDEALDLLEEIMDIVDSINEDTGPVYCWQDTVNHLKNARDCLVRSLKEDVLSEEVDLNESFKAGSLKLKDKSTVKISKSDAKALNNAIGGTASGEKLYKQATKTKEDFEDFLDFALNINEDFESGIEALLSEASIEDLEYIIEKELDEGQSWDTIKNSAKLGALSGAAVGAAAGGVYGGAIGVGIAAAKKMRQKQLQKQERERQKQEREREADQRFYARMIDEDQSKSVLGTAAPAMDSDEDDENKEDALDESKISGHKFSNSIGGDSSNYRTPTTPLKFNKPTSDSKDKTYKIPNNRANIYGDFAKKVGDIVNVKSGSNHFHKMKVIDIKDDMLTVAYLKEEDLQEVSKRTLHSYIRGSIDDQMSLYFNKETDPLNGKNKRTFDTSADAFKFAMKRQKGIERAENALDRKESISALYKRLGIKKD